jgi:hypothetical protein
MLLFKKYIIFATILEVRTSDYSPMNPEVFNIYLTAT